MSKDLTSANIEVSKEALSAMREWVSECQWGDLGDGDIDELSDEQILRGVQRSYSGGIAQFIRDFDPFF